MTEYIAHIDSSGWDRFSQSLYVWRRNAHDGTLQIVSCGDLLVQSVTVPEGQMPDAKPFMKYSTALWPEIDGILKALHDLYRQTHGLDKPSGADAAKVEVLQDALELERQRVDKVLNNAIIGGRRIP